MDCQLKLIKRICSDKYNYYGIVTILLFVIMVFMLHHLLKKLNLVFFIEVLHPVFFLLCFIDISLNFDLQNNEHWKQRHTP